MHIFFFSNGQYGGGGGFPSDFEMKFISWFRPFMSALQLKANACEHVQRRGKEFDVEQSPNATLSRVASSGHGPNHVETKSSNLGNVVMKFTVSYQHSYETVKYAIICYLRHFFSPSCFSVTRKLFQHFFRRKCTISNNSYSFRTWNSGSLGFVNPYKESQKR